MARVLLLIGIIAFVSPLFGQTSSPSASPSLEQRIVDLEAYVNNSARGSDSSGIASNIPGPGSSYNAWMMTCAALVLFMTLPGLALFYGGLVRAKNVLSVLAQCLGIAGLVTILWWAVGYSLVFSRGSPFIGGLKFAFLNGVDARPNSGYSYWVSQNVFAMYQLMFAIITPALIIGAVAERMKFAAVLAFVTVWMFAVYFPIAHMVWGIDGWMNGVWNPAAKIIAIDFAGGTVVHMSSGWSALVLCILLGHRLGFRREIMAPHSMVLCMVGTGLLWVGWYGFNAGSALAPDGIAANAFTTTTLATAIGSFTWAMVEYALRGKPSVLGFCSGAVAGLVVITPACGYVAPTGAVIIGIAAGIVPFFACTKLKSWLGYDDALDTFGIHAVGGTLGAFLTGLFATATVNPNLSLTTAGPLNPATQNGLARIVGHTLWIEQLKARHHDLASSGGKRAHWRARQKSHRSAHRAGNRAAGPRHQSTRRRGLYHIVNQDREHLQLLAIFHYVIAGLAALLSFFPLFYSLIGGFLLYAAQHPGANNQEPPSNVFFFRSEQFSESSQSLSFGGNR